MAHHTRIGAIAAALATASLTITPAYAAPLAPHTGSVSPYAGDFSAAQYEADNTQYHRRYRGYRRNRIDGGDVLAGVLILGGIAAIASAASNSNERREREERRREYEQRRYDDRRYDDNRRSNPRSSDGSGIDNAVSICLAEIEQDVRVDSVDGATRNASGWMVSGTLFNGSGFTCQIDNNGRISNVDFGGFSGASYSEGEEAPGQWSEARYADARAAMGRQEPDMARIETTDPSAVDDDLGPQPAYPGGPLPGEEGYPGE